MANFNSNLENFITSNEKSDGTITLSADQFRALFDGYKDVVGSQAGATTRDANTALQIGLQGTDDLYSSCFDCSTQQGAAPAPEQAAPAPEPTSFRPYEGAGVQSGAERAFNRGDRAFAKEVEKLTSAGEGILALTSEGQSPADIRSFKRQVIEDLHDALGADRVGRRRFDNGARRLGDAGLDGDLSTNDIRLAIRAVRDNNFSSALGLIQNRIDGVTNGVQTVRDRVNFGFLDTGV